MARVEAHPPSATAHATAGNVWLFVRCHDWFMAMEATCVERIVGFTDVRLLAGTGSTSTPGDLGLGVAAGRNYAAWDLGVMLETEALVSSWVLLKLPTPAGTLPIALRTGTCLSVGPLALNSVLELPPGIMRARPGALSGAFPAAGVHARRKARSVAGLTLDLKRLWSRSELDGVTETLAQAEAPNAERLRGPGAASLPP